MTDRPHLYLDGAWTSPASTETIPVENPATEEILGHVPAGTPEDVDRAVAAARSAFDGWAATPMAERGAVLDRLHTALAARAGEIARTVGLELGTPLKVAKAVQAGLPLTVLRGYADLAARPAPEETIGNSLIVHEPVGVVGAITPWNYPLHQVVAKVAAALAAGCTVVLKPSELTPLVACLLFDAADEAGVPAGVLNLVTGTGAAVGAAIAGHPDVDMVSFTGSTATGRAITHAAADRIAKVSLELGGKSANVILADADVTRAVKVGVGNAFLNSGQTCTAWTRMLVHRDLYDEAVALAAKTASGYTVGDPFDEGSGTGCAASSSGPTPGWWPVAWTRRCRTPGTSWRRPSSPTSTRRVSWPRRRSSARCCRSSRSTTTTRPSRSPTIRDTDWPAASGAARTGRSRWRSGCAPARSTSTAAPSTRTPRSAGTSSRGSDANWASTVLPSSAK
jgi:aldehyde dehydrogenase (NAD+)